MPATRRATRHDSSAARVDPRDPVLSFHEMSQKCSTERNEKSEEGFALRSVWSAAANLCSHDDSVRGFGWVGVGRPGSTRLADRRCGCVTGEAAELVGAWGTA